MSSSAIIRALEPDDLEGVFALYRVVFGDEALARFRRRWRWEFFDNPNTRELPSRLQVAVLDGEIVGFVGAFPVRQKVFDREYVVRRSCDLMVSETARKHDPTIGVKLLNTMRDGPGDTMWVGMGYSPQHRLMRQRLGHKFVDLIPFYIRPQDVRPIIRFVGGANGSRRPWYTPPASWLLEGAGALANLALATMNRVRMPARVHDCEVEAITSAGDEIDTLWRTTSPEIPIIAVRDRQFVQWRFFDDHVFENTVLLARGRQGRPLGYLALRLADKGPMRLGRILDVYCAPGSSSTVAALLRAALEHFRRQRVAVVSCMGLHPAIRETVQRYLYVRPANRQNPATLFWKGDPALRDAVYDAANWHLSHADGDEGFAP